MEFSASVGFIYKESVMMYGHVIVKFLFLIIGYSTNPHCFKNIRKFPTRHIVNRKVGVTQAILLTIEGH